MKSKRSKATDIPQKVKKVVWARDGGRCVICGSSQAMPNAHYISRAHGGRGVPKNIVTLCADCHRRYDNSVERDAIGARIREYLQKCYPNWDENEVVYDKWAWTK